MANLRLCAKNAFEFAPLTASPAAVATLPVTNLQLPARARVWRSTTDAAQTLFATWNGSGHYLNFVMLSRHNLEAGATWRVQVYSDAAWTTQVYDSGTVDAYDFATLGELDFGVEELGSSVFNGFLGQMFSLAYFARVLALSVKVTISNVGNAAGYVQASQLFGGDYTELTYNAREAGLAWRETGGIERSAGGTPRTEASVAWRELDLNLASVSAADRPTLMDMLRYAGKRRPVFAALYPGAGGEKERDYTMVGKFIDLPDVTAGADRLNLWATRLRLGEI